jgi:sigma-B regulation protein RsbU (phosphoserine phosphatase)
MIQNAIINAAANGIDESSGGWIHEILDALPYWARFIEMKSRKVYLNARMKEDLNKDDHDVLTYVDAEGCFGCNHCIRVIAENTGMSVEKERKIGSRFYQVRNVPIKNQEGDVFGILETFVDITPRKELEERLIRNKVKLDRDLDFSRSLQEKILPANVAFDHVAVDYIYRPSEILSGDMFDIFEIQDGRYTGMYISDVVGHGVSASLLTMFIRQSMRALKDESSSPAEILQKLHHSFSDLELEADKYFTIVYAVYDHETRILSYANGGHICMPILKRGDGVIEILEGSGYPISSLFAQVSFQEMKTQIRSDDRLLLFTDGLLEAKGDQGQQFGMERLLHVVRETKSDANLISNIDLALRLFAEDEQKDDFAMMKIRFI